jgi:hypothetical protein
MDGWMDGWIDRWMDGWTDRWMDKQGVTREGKKEHERTDPVGTG